MQGSRGLAIIVAIMLLTPASAHAGVSGSIDLVSDYRFRGVSLSHRRGPAMQATVHADKGPLFVEGFVTTLGRGDSDAPAETDISLGATHKLGKGTVTLSAIWYLYPGAHQAGVYEIIRRAMIFPVGKSTLSMTAGYAPDQHALRGKGDNLYLGLSATVPIGRPRIIAGIGRERGALSPETKIDWQLGAQMDVSGFDGSVSYIDSDRRLRDNHGRDLSGDRWDRAVPDRSCLLIVTLARRSRTAAENSTWRACTAGRCQSILAPLVPRLPPFVELSRLPSASSARMIARHFDQCQRQQQQSPTW